MRRKKADDLDVQASRDGRITPGEVQQVEFRLSFRGYNERDVDAFLDRITEDLSAYLAELEQVRDGAPAGIAAAAGPDAGAARQAEAILSRAREEASAIVRRAEQQAAAIGATGAGGGDARAAVAPFLNTEREFLQALGGLVQTHAEEIKQMVLALRARAESSPSPSSAPAPAMPDRRPDASPEALAGASAAEIRERLGEPEPPAAPPQARERDPIVVDPATEPAYSSEGAPGTEGRERSLRELFWGED